MGGDERDGKAGLSGRGGWGLQSQVSDSTREMEGLLVGGKICSYQGLVVGEIVLEATD